MGTKERRKREIEEMRLEIIEAAVQLFLTDGYENVSMRKIAQQIDYSATAIYKYFANKEEILIHLLKHGYAIFLTYLKEGVANCKSSDPGERLKASLYAYIDFGLKHPEYYRLIFIENLHQLQKVMTEEDDRVRGFVLLTEMVMAAMNEGVLKKHDAHMAAQSLWASLHGITSLLITFPDFHWHEKEGFIDFQVNSMIKGLT
ncbi:TetR/AcrR family transcriptional regulator [Neobacillus bataviensis]|uniref:TetR/AcrR family transcriptional regulator n=1 Tax=Neobacillus bataviensis TaxID=220685 RepID=UPI001CBB9264|nr:TetR/AcrR family transcriptional regulator [Neobacillus bataviensis]